MSPSSPVPELPVPPPPSTPTADASATETAEELPDQRSSTMLVILMLLANLLFVALIYPAAAVSELNSQISAFNGKQVSGVWFLFWPGLAIVWAAAWLGFLIFGLTNRIRTAQWVFVLTAGLWVVPVTLYIVSGIAGN